MMSKQDFLIFIKARAALSTWKPNFDDAEVADSWYDELKHFPFDVFRKVLKSIGGQKQFPSVAELIAACQGAMPKKDASCPDKEPIPVFKMIPRITKAENNRLMAQWDSNPTKNKARKELYQRILRIDEMQYILRWHFNDYKFIEGQLISLSYFEELHPKLEEYYHNISLMFSELAPGRQFDFDPNKGRPKDV